MTAEQANHRQSVQNRVKLAVPKPVHVMDGLPEAERKQFFAMVLWAKEGNVSQACQTLGISRQMYKTWIETDPEFYEECYEVTEALVDLGQSALIDNVKDHKSTDIQFLLKTLGKDRGYGEKVQVEHTGSIQHDHGIGYYPPEPKSIAEWEAQVEEARRLRAEQAKLTDGQSGQSDQCSDAPSDSLTTTSEQSPANTGPVPRHVALVPVT